jgi:hypothetical protein
MMGEQINSPPNDPSIQGGFPTMTLSKLLTLGILVGISFQATAGPATDSLAACLADSTSGKDRKDLAKWVFTAMSAHPEIKEIVTVQEKDREQMDQVMATLLTRLITVNCLEQARKASKEDGSNGFKTAFAALGQLAMQELMTNSEVTKSIGAFEKYVDTSKFKAAFGDK